KHQEAFSIDSIHQMNVSAIRGRLTDQGMAHNVVMQGVSGKKVHDIYVTAWNSGLKTTYYLRTLGATQTEKATLDANKFGFTQKRIYKVNEESFAHISNGISENGASEAQTQEFSMEKIEIITTDEAIVEGKICSISSDPDCEVC